MPIWTKISGVWKKIDRVYTRVSGAWREVNPAKVRVSGNWHVTHELIPPFYYPSGSILPYWGNIGGLPSGWSHYGACPDQYMPIGVNTWSLGQATGSGTVVLTSGSTTNHTGNQYTGFGHAGDYCHVEYASNLTPEGGHNHSFQMDPNQMLPHLRMPFIQATSNRQEHPAYGVVFGFGTNLSSTGLSIINWGSGTNYFLSGRGSSTTNQSFGDEWLAGYPNIVTSSYGGHYHRGVWGYAHCYWNSSSYIVFHSLGGAHSHTTTIYANNWPQHTLLGSWWTGGSTVPNVGGYGTMVMYPSATAPARWSICNGSNGTPDMRDRFAKLAGGGGFGGSYGGSFYPTWHGLTNHAGSHYHFNNVLGFANAAFSQNYHNSYEGNESHAFYDNRWWAPNLWGIYWIMYTG